MEFRTKLVIKRRNKRAIGAYIGLGITACSLLLVFIPPLSWAIPYVFGAGIAVLVIGAFVAKGDLATYGLSDEELVIDSHGIKVGAQHYSLQQLTNLDFNVEAYDGLYVNDGAMVSGSKSDGMTNSLSFEVGGKKQDYGFYLESKVHVQQLAFVFNDYYTNHVPFVERNRNARTYMFQHLTAPELEAFKERYGYK